MCIACDQNPDFDPIDRATWCNSCVGRDWVYTTELQVEAIAAEYGWSLSSWNGGFNTSSRYVTLSRACGEMEDGEYLDLEEVKVRVSDHGSAYCSEDISLALHPSGDDSDLEALKKRLSRSVE